MSCAFLVSTSYVRTVYHSVRKSGGFCGSPDASHHLPDGQLGKAGRRPCGGLEALGKRAAGRKAETKGGSVPSKAM